MGIGFRELLVILAIALLVFGAKKLRNIGSDLGAAVRGFKKGMNEDDAEAQKNAAVAHDDKAADNKPADQKPADDKRVG
jgi:sec-independent protein translocase protein TatA